MGATHQLGWNSFLHSPKLKNQLLLEVESLRMSSVCVCICVLAYVCVCVCSAHCICVHDAYAHADVHIYVLTCVYVCLYV